MRKHLVLFFAAALGAAGAAGPSEAQETADLTMIGGRARGMGGAYTAVASGPDAMAWNPAGLAEIDRPALQADTRLNFGSGTITSGIEIFSAGSAGDSEVLRFTDSPGTRFTYYLVGGGAPLPLRGRLAKVGLVGAAGYRRVVDRLFRREQLIVFDPGGGFSVPLEHIDDSRGGVDAYTLALAGRPHPRLALGLDVNLLTGFIADLEEQRVAFQGREFFALEQRTRQGVGGHSFDLGARLTVLPELTVAATLHPSFDIELDGGPSQQRVLALEGAPIPAVDTTFGFRLPDETWTVPTFYNVGAAAKPLRGLLVAADYQYRPWNESELVVHAPSAGDITIDQGFYPTHSFHVGGEYHLNREGSVTVPLRIGFHSTPTALANVDSLSLEVDAGGFRDFRGDRVEGHTWSGGIGIHFPTVHFDVALDRTALTFSEFFFGQFPIPGQALTIIEIDETYTNLYFTSTLRF